MCRSGTMAHDRDPVHPEQHASGEVARGHLAHNCSGRAQVAIGPPDSLRGPRHCSLDSLEQDIAGEAVGDDHLGAKAISHVTALDIADEIDAEGRQPSRQFVKGEGSQVIPLAGLVADIQQADTRRLDTEGPRIAPARDRVRRQDLGRRVKEGPGINEDDWSLDRREDNCKCRTRHAGNLAARKDRSGHRSPGVSDRHPCIDGTGTHRECGDHDAYPRNFSCHILT